jgi:4-amino-4-deoxy-L-arabinose transferase-like glycosyltransferase
MSKSDVAWWQSPRVAPLLVFAFALMLFSLNLDRPPHPDELHHALAAKGLQETGRPALAEGEYWRGLPHTWMVAASYTIFGEGLASARIPTVILVAAVALILFAWIRREVDSLAAWMTAVLFISSPFAVEIAQFSRFYALQMLCFMLGSIGVYVSAVRQLSLARRLLLIIGATALLVTALLLQITTAIGLFGVAVWAAGLAAVRFYTNSDDVAVKRKWATTGLILVGIAIFAIAYITGVLDLAWDRFRATSLTNSSSRNEFWFYHVRFLLFYPTLWPLAGLFAVLAIIRSPKLAWLCIAIFVISFLLGSFAGPKNTRYLSFATPFLAIIWGIGLAHILPALRNYTELMRARLVDTLSLPHRFRSVMGTSAVFLILAIVLIMNPFWIRTAALIGNVALPMEIPATDWRTAREALAPWTRDAGIMITTEELGAIFFLGRSDVRFSPSKLQELPPDQQREFGIDFRTGRPIITTPSSVEKLIDCFPQGFIVGPIENWGDPILISEEIQAVLERRAEPIEVPQQSYLYAWGWNREPVSTEPAYCSDLKQFSGRQLP